VVRKPRKHGNRRKPKRQPRQQGGSSLAAAMRLLADPCKAPMVPGMFGTDEGMLTRVHKVLTKSGTSTDTAFVILWFPDYATQGDYDDVNSLFMFANASTSVNPANSVAAPYGTQTQAQFLAGGSMPTAASVADPATPLSLDPLVADMRCISACLRLDYLGKTSDGSGAVSTLENVPYSAILNGGPGNVCPSIDQWQTYATSTRRLGVEGICLVSRTNEEAHTFRTTTDGPFHTGEIAIKATVTTTAGDISKPTAFGLLVTGLDAAATNPFIISLTKVIEWRAKTVTGMMEVPPRVIHAAPLIPAAEEVLDRIAPGWTASQANLPGSTGGDIIKAVMSGATSAIKGAKKVSGAITAVGAAYTSVNKLAGAIGGGGGANGGALGPLIKMLDVTGVMSPRSGRSFGNLGSY